MPDLELSRFSSGYQGSQNRVKTIWGLPKIRVPFVGVPIIRTIVYWGLHWGPPYFGKLPYLPIVIFELQYSRRRILSCMVRPQNKHPSSGVVP